MLNLFTPESKAQIVTSILRETANGSDLRACCRAQGITYQTFIDWRQWAQKENRLHGHETTVKKARVPAQPLQNALQAALTKVAEVAQGPDLENPPPFIPSPDQFKASTGFDLPGPFCAADMPAPDADFMAAVERDIVAQEQTQAQPEAQPETAAEPYEGLDMPQKTSKEDESRSRRSSAQIAAAAARIADQLPWLADVEARTIEQAGPKPDRLRDMGAYNKWVALRKTLMSPQQRAQFEAFYGRVFRPDAAPAAKPFSKAAYQETLRANGKAREVREALQAQHADMTVELALHPEALTHAIEIEPMTAQPQRRVPQVAQAGPWITHATPEDMAAEIARMQRIITVLTAENMRLRGIL